MLNVVTNFAVIFGCVIISTAKSETSCRIPEAPENGSVEAPNEPGIGTLAYYSCKDDATLVGESISTCLPSGKWSFDAPKCLRSCYVLEIEDGQLGKYEWKNQFTRRDFISFQIGKSVKHHEKAILLCKDDYIPGNQEMGRSQEVKCNDGSWSEPLYCRPKISCEMPDAPKYGSVQLSDKLKVGTLAFFSCDEGATLIGIPTIKCLPSGKWSFDPPTCLHSCLSSPPAIENAEVVAINAKHGGSVLYRCDKDFTKLKNETVVCDFGIWKGDPPLCKKNSCGSIPPSVENARVVSVNGKHGGRVTYECDKGFEKFMNETIFCDFGTWKGNLPVCRRGLPVTRPIDDQEDDPSMDIADQAGNQDEFERCDNFPPLPNLQVRYFPDSRMGRIAFFRCLNGTSLVGMELARCLTNRTWSHSSPTCTAASCRSSPPFIENTEIVNINAKHGGNVIYKCDKDFTKIKNETVVCDFGIWKGDPPLCKKKFVKCDFFPILRNLNVRYTHSARMGSFAFFACLNNATLVGKAFARCLSNRTWSNPLPSCEDGSCPPNNPFSELASFPTAKRREELKTIFCENYDYVWKGRLNGHVRKDGGFLNISFTIENVIKAGIEKADDIEDETRTLLARDNCQTANLFPGATYLILGKDGLNYMNENGETWYRYLLDKTSVIHLWTSPREAKNKNLQRDLNFVTRTLKENGCEL